MASPGAEALISLLCTLMGMLLLASTYGHWWASYQQAAWGASWWWCWLRWHSKVLLHHKHNAWLFDCQANVYIRLLIYTLASMPTLCCWHHGCMTTCSASKAFHYSHLILPVQLQQARCMCGQHPGFDVTSSDLQTTYRQPTSHLLCVYLSSYWSILYVGGSAIAWCPSVASCHAGKYIAKVIWPSLIAKVIWMYNERVMAIAMKMLFIRVS